mmetsp:Transcript_8527/g.9654  ORF Transcript_8527/g.9654 Transcript_8527/m.9654 type:complete len:192 (-) Transcript_8527:52-627(-)
MDNALGKTRRMYFYPPSKAIVPKATKPGVKESPANNQLYRQTGPVPKHLHSPEPWPKKRFHQGEPTDLFVLQGGTAEYTEAPKKVTQLPQKDVSAFYGLTKTSYRNVGEKHKFGDSVMKFYGDGTALNEKRERNKETIEKARHGFNFMQHTQPQKATMSTLANMTLKQEMKDFNKIPLSYSEAREQIYGNK